MNILKPFNQHWYGSIRGNFQYCKFINEWKNTFFTQLDQFSNSKRKRKIYNYRQYSQRRFRIRMVDLNYMKMFCLKKCLVLYGYIRSQLYSNLIGKRRHRIIIHQSINHFMWELKWVSFKFDWVYFWLILKDKNAQHIYLNINCF